MVIALSIAQGAGGPVPRAVKVDIGEEVERKFIASLSELCSLLVVPKMTSAERWVGVSESVVSSWPHARRASQRRFPTRSLLRGGEGCGGFGMHCSLWA